MFLLSFCFVHSIKKNKNLSSIGGVYPLTSASAFEGSSKMIKDDKDGNTIEARRRAGWVVFWQSPGQMLPYCVGLLILSLLKQSSDDVKFRMVLGIGCVLPLCILIHIAIKSNFMFGFDVKETSSSLTSIIFDFSTLMHDPKVRYPLLGCMISWALFDIYIYSEYYPPFCTHITCVIYIYIYFFVNNTHHSKYNNICISSYRHCALHTNHIGEDIRRCGVNGRKHVEKWYVLCSVKLCFVYFFNFNFVSVTWSIYFTLFLFVCFLYIVISIAATFPATLLTVYLLGKYHTRTLQIVGFAAVGVFSVSLAISWYRENQKINK